MDWEKELEGMQANVLFSTLGTEYDREGNVATILLADGDYVRIDRNQEGFNVELVGCGLSETNELWECDSTEDVANLVKDKAMFALTGRKPKRPENGRC